MRAAGARRGGLLPQRARLLRVLLLALVWASCAECHALHFSQPQRHGQHRECVHDTLAEGAVRAREAARAAVPKDAHLALNGLARGSAQRRRRLAEDASAQAAPLRVTPIYQLPPSAALTPTKADFLQYALIPAALAELARYISVRRPVRGVFHLPWTCASGGAACVGGSGALCAGGVLGCSERRRYATCFSATEDGDLYGATYTTAAANCNTSTCHNATFTPGGPGLNGTDFALYVTAKDEPYCANAAVLAMGATCETDPWSGRPLSGNANFCPRAVRPAAAADGGSDVWGMALDAAMHEVLHGLGFNARMFDTFVGPDGAAPLQPPALDVLPDWANGSAAFMATPGVREAARRHFGATSLPGVPLERSGGAATRGSHWEARWLRGDLMTGSQLSRAAFSRVTLGALSDSGWYVPTGGGASAVAGGLRWGKGAGDEFVTQSCAARPLPAALAAGGWCDAAAEGGRSGCSADKRAAAFCGSDSASLQDGCSAWTPYANMHCWDPAHGTSGASVFGQTFGRGSRCLPSGGSAVARVDWGVLPAAAGCYPMRCDNSSSNGVLHLLVTVTVCDALPCAAAGATRAVEAVCPPGAFLELPALGLGFSAGRLGPCPLDPLPYCAGLGCPGDCGGDRGACVNPTGLPGGGRCVCHAGYIGAACAEVACTPAACAASNATCSALSGRCVAADGTQLSGEAVREPVARFGARPPPLRR